VSAASIDSGADVAAAGERPGERPRVCIFSRKDLERVTRVTRQAGALQEAGWDVTVVSLKKPLAETVDGTPGVEYLEVALEPWAQRVLGQRRRKLTARAARADRLLKPLPTPLRSALQALRVALRFPFALLAAALLRLPGDSLLGTAGNLARARTSGGAIDTAIGLFRQHANTLSFADAALKALGERSIAVCQAHDNYALLAAHRAAEAKGAALVYDAVEIAEHRLAIRTSLLGRLVSRFERRQERQIFGRAAFVTTIGDGLADWYARRYRMPRPLPVRNCRHFWEYAPRDEIREDCRAEPGESIVAWFGYAYPDQGLEALIETAAHLDDSVHIALLAAVLPRWETFLLELRNRVTDLDLEARVHFLPPRDPDALIPYVSGADLGIIPRPNVSPNIFYSMPNKFMEMVMARLPIAVSDLADMRILIDRYGLGATFDVADPVDIARVVTEMLVPSRLAELRDAVDLAASDLCWERESQAYVERYAELAQARGLATVAA
jgi:glycosyltransferase involved in cell wall biosynthesis